MSAVNTNDTNLVMEYLNPENTLDLVKYAVQEYCDKDDGVTLCTRDNISISFESRLSLSRFKLSNNDNNGTITGSS